MRRAFICPSKYVQGENELLNLGYFVRQYGTTALLVATKSSVSRRGLGFDKPDPRNNNASPTSPRAPITVYGHTGFTGTCFWVDPTNDMIFIFLSNRVTPARSPNRLSTLMIRERIQEELYKALDQSEQ